MTTKNPQRAANNAWKRKPQICPQPQLSQAERTFKAAKAEAEKNIKKHVKTYESSSDEEDLENNSILSSVLEQYSNSGGSAEIIRTKQYIENCLQSGALTCAICICSIKRQDPIWSCEKCFSLLHLPCIKQWVLDSLSSKMQDSQILSKIRKANWACPNCRHEYDASTIPDRYYCFCGKTENPRYHPWLIPHSCGEECQKELIPSCGHNCLLLCHPGPCPSCPRMVKSKCFCGKSAPKPNRCSAQNWSCGEICRGKLLCGKHTCTLKCHPEECMVCREKSLQPCFCGAQKKIRSCDSPKWQCTKVCGKQLDCGNHICEVVCHSGNCKPCKLNGEQFCPCGKTTHNISCIEPTPTCGDTCGKQLDCGAHFCMRRCHLGKCGSCVERRIKKCRCGKNSKEIPCIKEFFCEIKCKLIKSCGRHSCNRKCCDGNCPPCEKPCGQSLECGNHKCPITCHIGRCYPCNFTVPVTCRCGSSKINVSCGRKKNVKPPTCSQPCTIVDGCPHEHRCHFGDCPECSLKCSRRMKCGHHCPKKCHRGSCPPCENKCNLRMKCGHHCQKKCHSGVLVSILSKDSSAVPEKKRIPCGECQEPVKISCLGGHEEIEVPCSEAKPTSCGRPCGNPLPCTNHLCQKPCHENKRDCEECLVQCQKPQKPGCIHPCLRTCHPGSCRVCKSLIKMSCHCNVLTKFIECNEWCSASKEEQVKLRSCGNVCSKTFACGHPCTEICHPGPCPAESCRKKTKVFCPCHRIKSSVACDLLRSGKRVECDEVCQEKKKQEQLQKEKEEAEKERIRKEKEEKELELYQKKMSRAPRKRTHQRRKESNDSPNFFKQYLLLSLFGLVIVFISILYFFKY